MARPKKAAASRYSAAAPSRSSSRRQQLRSSYTVPDSDDSRDSDLLDRGSSFTQDPGSATSSFRGVFVPPPRLSSLRESTMKSSARTGRTDKSLSSAASAASPSPFTRENSNEIDTSATTLTTPTESVLAAESSKSRPSRTTNNVKRKRPGRLAAGDALDDAAADEQLARALQEEEYGGQSQKRAKTQARGRKPNRYQSDSDDGAADLSFSFNYVSDDSEDVPLSAGATHRTTQKQIPLRRKKTTNPASHLSSSFTTDTETNQSTERRRAAPARGRSNMKTTQTVEDSEDESDLSNYSDADFASASYGLGFLQDLDNSDDDSDVDQYGGFENAPQNVQERYTARRRHWNMVRDQRAARERRKLENAHPEIKTMWSDLQAVPKIPVEEAPQPETISRRLKGFQLEGLNWMQKQEKTQWKGGLLGDEMGMGKTIQAVSLIMSDYPAKQPTLVVVPPVALMQWTNEIKEYTDGKLKVLVYHGTNAKAKKMSVKELKTFDVILISYSGLESIYRRETKGWTRGDEIYKEDSAMHAIHFHRLILDEAHSIKSRTTGVAKACFALKGTYKWCLSGTPVQNRIGEFFSLLRFLGIEPFANYFCKNCSCSSIHWSVNADYRCTHCNHRGLDHVSVFNQEILNPITSRDSDEVRREALGKLRIITDRIMLRRLKRDQTASMELPPKEIVVHNEFFGEIERDFSASIMSNTTRQFDTYVSRGVMLNNYANIFGLIMQMRQVSDHPDLLLKKHSEGGQNVLVCNICDEPAEDAIRSRCKHDFCRACAKDYVRTCDASGATPDCPRCHIALTIDFEQPEIEQDEESVKKNSIINRIKMENWTSSTKIEMLVYDLYKLRSKRQTLKSIVFSQFTSMLQLIEWRLRRAGFNTVMLDGSMTPAQRQKSIEYFMNNTHVEVFLVSLKAGGVALNLTEASRVFIVDPWWNPAAEWQSADRCHRIGQKRPCVITRLCIEDSVESRIVMLQEKKANLINGTVNNDDVAMEKLTPEDMQFLFRGS